MTEFWDRYTELKIIPPSGDATQGGLAEEMIITTDQLEIYFTTHQYDDGSTGKIYSAATNLTDPTVVADIGIFNLSDATIDAIKSEDRATDDGSTTRTGGSIVTLISGYRNHHDVVFTGVVAAVTQESSGTDVMTILKCRDDKYLVKRAVVNKTFNGCDEKGVPVLKISDFVTSLANTASIPIGRIDAIDILYGSRTCTPDMSLHEIFKEIAAECCKTGLDVRYAFKHGALYFTNAEEQGREIYVLNAQTGLLNMQRSKDTVHVNDAYDVTTLLIPDIEYMGMVQVGNFDCAVTTKPVHTSNGEEHCTRFTATIAGQNVVTTI